MSTGFLTRSSRLARGVSLAIAVACGAAATMPDAAFAGSGEPAHLLFRNKKKADTAGVSKQNWSHGATGGGKATTVSRVVNDGSVAPFLGADSVAAMQAVADRYAAIVAAGGWPRVPSGKMKKGSANKAVVLLNKRLHAEGYLRVEATEGEFAGRYTTATEEAVRRFQQNHGLAVTGTIDGATLAQLNVPADRRLATIRANLPRIAEYSKELGSRYAVVNIPAAQIETVENGRVYSIHNAIVGRASRPTPVVMTPLTMIRFNPYWNAPASIVEKDIVPRMLSSGPSKVMADMNMKIFQGVGGPEVSPNKVNWRRAVVDDYHFRQEPGGSNAMASAKIEFTSPFGIYLHDTPEPHLFETGQRFYSSGCVRVQKVATFIDWVLRGQDGINGARIAALAESKERLDTPIADAPQLRVAYLTAWPAGGIAAFRDDVYELDGTGFVVGQPLPVGETQGGKRFVLKPIPRSPEAVDADEAFGFASLFRSRNPDKDVTGARSTADADDSLLTSRKKPAARTARTERRAGTRNADRQDASSSPVIIKNNATAKPAKRKVAEKKKTKARLAKALEEKDASGKKAAGRKVRKTDTAEVAARKPDDKMKTAATESKASDKAKKPAKPAKATAPSCKADKNGKLPDGCKAPAAAKKPAKKPEQTAAAKPTSAAAN